MNPTRWECIALQFFLHRFDRAHWRFDPDGKRRETRNEICSRVDRDYRHDESGAGLKHGVWSWPEWRYGADGGGRRAPIAVSGHEIWLGGHGQAHPVGGGKHTTGEDKDFTRPGSYQWTRSP